MLFPVYSVAKSFTAAAALRAFDPDARIGDLVPVPGHLADLVLRDLLAHRSGLDDYGSWPEYAAAVAARESAWPDAVVLERATRSTPGEFRYSNTGYLLVRLALEAAYDAPFLDVLRRLVLDEWGVTAYPFETTADWERCAPSRVPDVRRYDPRWVHTGTFVSDAESLAGGLRRLLRSEVAAAMLATLPVDAPGHPLEDPGYGLGLMTGGVPPRVAGHGGGGPGFTLFALATADGARAHVEVVPDEVDASPLVRDCLATLADR